MTETEAGASGDSPTILPLDLPKAAETGPAAAGHGFDVVYSAYFPFVWRCLRGLGIAPSALDDAAQDVFIVVYRRLSDFRGDSTLRTWLYGIVRHVAANHRRAVRRRGRAEPLEPELPSHSAGPAELAEASEAAAFVQRFLAGLDRKKREVFMLAAIEEMSMPEVARALEIPLNTAYTRLRLARAEFQKAMHEEAVR